MQFLKKDDTHMLVLNDDTYITWINKQPYGVKVTHRERYFKLAFQWGKNGTGTNRPA